MQRTSATLQTHLPERVTLFEVGPRDGLQNEPAAIDLDTKVSLIDALSETGLNKIEAGSFVSPKWVPQMADSQSVFAKIQRNNGVAYAALTPNLRGADTAFESKVDEIAVFAAASEGFSQKNINCSIAESIERFTPVMEQAKDRDIPVRGYVSCVIACPYDGDTAAEKVAEVASVLNDIGCYQISLGDTIGVGTPLKTIAMIEAVQQQVPIEKLALHCHDTYGQAVANIYAALQVGITTFDSSVAGLGGCPYAKGASGNVATEDVLYLMQGLGIHTGVSLEKVVDIGNRISRKLGRKNQSRVARALSS